MSDTTPRLEMPYILPSQAQKHVTHNSALKILDALLHLAITSAGTTPPASPVEGSCHLVSTPAGGAWSGQDGRIAAFQDGAWQFLKPREGWRAWFAESGELKLFDGENWIDLSLPQQASFTRLGIAATPDETNRLALSSPASLFNHAGQGHQLKINKAAAGETASLLFQSSWTGYAEMGLAGNTDFSIKVSDGSNWKTGLSIDAAGRVSRPQQPTARAYRSGTSFTPASGQQSGFDTYTVNQGGFTFGAAAAGGGSAIVVPAGGLYLATATIIAATSSGHGTTLLRNGAETVLAASGAAATTETGQTMSGIVSLAAGDRLTLGHTGTATIAIGATRTILSLVML